MSSDVLDALYEHFLGQCSALGIGAFDGKAGQKFAVALSGGPDSTLLAYYVKRLCDAEGHTCCALIVDHQIRAESRQDVEVAVGFCRRYAIPYAVITLEISGASRLQERARQMRYEHLELACHKRGIHYLFLGQHRDDQAETFVMRLLKGSTLQGLAGMRYATTTPLTTRLRPLLRTPKARILAALRELRVTTAFDASNDNAAYERVKIRKRKPEPIFPVQRQVALERVRDALEAWVGRFLGRYAIHDPLGTVLVDLSAFQRLPQSFQETLVQYITRASGIGPYPPSRRALARLLPKINQHNSSTLKGLSITCRGGKIWFYRNLENAAAPLPLKQLSGPVAFWDHRFLLDVPGLKETCPPDAVIQPPRERDYSQVKQQIQERHPETVMLPCWNVPTVYVQGHFVDLLPGRTVPTAQHPASGVQYLATYYSKSPFRAFFFDKGGA